MLWRYGLVGSIVTLIAAAGTFFELTDRFGITDRPPVVLEEGDSRDPTGVEREGDHDESPSIYPAGDNRALLRLIGSSARPYCSAKPVGPEEIARVYCRPPAGADELTLRVYRHGRTVQRYWIRWADPGRKRPTPRKYKRGPRDWFRHGGDLKPAGRMVQFFSKGRIRLYWMDVDRQMIMRATRFDGDPAAQFNWWAEGHPADFGL